MDAHDIIKQKAKEGYANLGSDTKGLQKMLNDKAKGDVLREFSSEIDAHDSKRLPRTGSPLRGLSAPAPQPKVEPLLPVDFDERLQKFLRD